VNCAYVLSQLATKKMVSISSPLAGHDTLCSTHYRRRALSADMAFLYSVDTKQGSHSAGQEN
jgi:hypothetical protein